MIEGVAEAVLEDLRGPEDLQKDRQSLVNPKNTDSDRDLAKLEGFNEETDCGICFNAGADMYKPVKVTCSGGCKNVWKNVCLQPCASALLTMRCRWC